MSSHVSGSSSHDAAGGAEFLELAVTLARTAGATAVAMRPDAIGTTTTKSSDTDPVTAADKAAEQLIVDGILAARPNDAIVGEEGGGIAGTTGVSWFVDPIDGTANYVYGIPIYAVSIAVEVDGSVVVGVVYNPESDELFTARRRGGAFRNGEPIRVNADVPLAKALMGTGFGYKPEDRAVDGAVIAELLPKIRDLRRLGSAALDLCAVAMGRFDAYFETGLHVWDYAAGALLVEEAGGQCCGLDGSTPGPEMMIAAHSPLANDLAGALKLAAETASVEGRVGRD